MLWLFLENIEVENKKSKHSKFSPALLIPLVTVLLFIFVIVGVGLAVYSNLGNNVKAKTYSDKDQAQIVGLIKTYWNNTPENDNKSVDYFEQSFYPLSTVNSSQNEVDLPNSAKALTEVELEKMPASQLIWYADPDIQPRMSAVKITGTNFGNAVGKIEAANLTVAQSDAKHPIIEDITNFLAQVIAYLFIFAIIAFFGLIIFAARHKRKI